MLFEPFLHDICRLVHTFVLCHFAYVAAMYEWQGSERDRLNALLRKEIKVTLGLPTSIYTETARLMQLGMHNALEEIAEAQGRAQLIRLSTTRSGRHIPKRIDIPVAAVDDNHKETPKNLRENIAVKLVPRNVHPIHNVCRRQARAKAPLEKA